MPYAVPAGAILECRLRSTLFNQVVINVFHYRSLTTYGDGQAALEAAAQDFNDVVWSAFAPQLAQEILATKIDAQWVFPTRFRVYTLTADPAGGQSAGHTNNTGTALVVRRFGEQANKHNQGRVFVYGIPNANEASGQWNGAFVAGAALDLRDACKAVIQTAIGEQLMPVIWSAPEANIGVPIVGAAVDPIIRYQRRRELGVGQ